MTYIGLSACVSHGTLFDGYKAAHYSIEDVPSEDDSDICWIEIDSADVALPVVGSDDNYYLTHNLDGEYSIYGTLFFHNDYPNVIYGHNMRDGSMFGKLSQVCEGDAVTVLKGDDEYSYIVVDILLLDDRYVPNENWYQASSLYLSTCDGDGRRVLVCELADQ